MTVSQNCFVRQILFVVFSRILIPIVTSSLSFYRNLGPDFKQFVCLFLALQPPVGHGLLIHEVSRSHTTTHHSRQDSPGRVISSSQRPPPDNTQHSQRTNIQATSGIRTHDLSRRAAADLRHRPRGYWDRQFKQYCYIL